MIFLSSVHVSSVITASRHGWCRVSTWLTNSEALDLSAAELAQKINVPANRVTQILNGIPSITGDTALCLARFFGSSAPFWLNLESLYDLRLREEKAGKSVKALPRLKRREPVPA